MRARNPLHFVPLAARSLGSPRPAACVPSNRLFLTPAYNRSVNSDAPDRAFLRRYAWFAIAGAVATIALKAGAHALTGSVGLLSDAVESLVNLAGALMALWMLTVAAREPDEEHAFGHSKAEYFSSGVEGSLIVVAAVSIAVAAVDRLGDGAATSDGSRFRDTASDTAFRDRA